MPDTKSTMDRLAVMMWNHDGEELDILRDCMALLAEQPQIVRCKDCKHWYPLTKTCNNVDGACCQSYVADDWFCADGERKEVK